MTFSERLYTQLDVDLLKVKLFEPVDQIVQKPLLYIRDMTPKASYQALMCINQLFSESLLRDVIRADLMPTGDMVLSMSKEFGVPLNQQELDDLKLTSSSLEEMLQNWTAENNGKQQQQHQQQQKQLQAKNSVNNEDQPGYVWENAAATTHVPHPSRCWTPIDNFNDKYLFKRKKNEALIEARNHLAENIAAVLHVSEKNKHKKPVKNFIVADGQAFNYSSQALNSTEMALNAFRDILNQV